MKVTEEYKALTKMDKPADDTSRVFSGNKSFSLDESGPLELFSARPDFVGFHVELTNPYRSTFIFKEGVELEIKEKILLLRTSSGQEYILKKFVLYFQSGTNVFS